MDNHTSTNSDNAQSIGGVSRREFIRDSAAAAAAISLVPSRLVPAVHASEKSQLKLAVVGCGGRGRGALANALEAASHLGVTASCVATCDFFSDRARHVGDEHGVPAERQFSGANGYKSLMQTDADVVILATPPNFRPVHLAAAVKAGKHVFMEKPVAVDPPGCRTVMKLSELADAQGLKIVAGTQRRHQKGFLRHAHAIADGAVGTIVAGQIYWCQSRLWYQNRAEGERDADYMVRNWVSFLEMSGDHIVEQHVHQIDVANWFIGRPPVSAVGFGGRHRRVTGNQYDQFSVEFDYGQGCSVHSMCRQIDGCYNRVDALFTGTEGRIWDERRLARYDKKDITLAQVDGMDNSYVQEHVDLQAAIVNGTPLNEARQVAESTMAAVMGRIAAYTGQQVTWEDLMENPRSAWYDLTLTPSALDFESDAVILPEEDVAPRQGT